MLVGDGLSSLDADYKESVARPGSQYIYIYIISKVKLVISSKLEDETVLPVCQSSCIIARSEGEGKVPHSQLQKTISLINI